MQRNLHSRLSTKGRNGLATIRVDEGANNTVAGSPTTDRNVKEVVLITHNFETALQELGIQPSPEFDEVEDVSQPDIHIEIEQKIYDTVLVDLARLILLF